MVPKAADQAYAKAQSNLGTMYESGHGIAKDDIKAVEWYQKAADQGMQKLNLSWVQCMKKWPWSSKR